MLRSIEVDDAPLVEHDGLLALLRWPRKVICAGVNYRRHVKEMGGAELTDDWKPFFFLKAPTTTVIGPTDPITLLRPETARYDWEAELAAVIGIGRRDIPREQALRHVAGYCVSNDITARGYHKRTSVPADAFAYDWFASKSIDGSLPLGPGITPAFQVADPQDLRIPAVAQRRARAGRVHQRHDLQRRRARRGGQRGRHARAGRRHPHRHPIRGRREPRAVPPQR